MNALLYARVSTEKQSDKDLSIPAQVQAMRDYAAQRQWTVADEFIEPGASARTADRPSLQRLLSRVRDGDQKIDVVLVHKIDRLARNVYDYATIKAFLMERGVRLASVVENTDDTVSGQLVENIMASIAQFYSANLGEEVRKGMRQKVLKGGWPHKAPRGYRTVRSADCDAGRVEVDPIEGRHIRAAYELYASGLSSFRDVGLMLAKAGITSSAGHAFSPGRVRRILSNSFYAGRLKWGGMDVEGQQGAVVSPTLFEIVQDTMRHRGDEPRSKGPVNGFPLRGVAICASCRSRMTASWQRSGTGRRFGYYKCTRRMYNKALCPNASSAPARAAHEQLHSICASLIVPAETLADIKDKAEDLIRRRCSEVDQSEGAIQLGLEALRQQEIRVTQQFVGEQLDPEAYRAALRELTRQRQESEARLARHPAEADRLRREVDLLLQDAETVGHLHDGLTDERQRHLLHRVFSHVVLDGTGVLGFALRPPFDALLSPSTGTSLQETSRALLRSVEPPSERAG
jgi:site-specific DNA recombinase